MVFVSPRRKQGPALLALRARFFSDQIAPAGSLVVDTVKARSFRPPGSWGMREAGDEPAAESSELRLKARGPKPRKSLKRCPTSMVRCLSARAASLAGVNVLSGF